MAKGRPWRTSPKKADRVKVTRPDPETGEVVEMTREQSTVKGNARRARREGEPPNLLEITPDERRKLVAGKLDRLFRQAKLPAVDGIVEETGRYVYIVAWDRPKPFADPEDGTVFTPDARPSCWVTVSKVPKTLTRGKGWTYTLKVEHHDRDLPDPLLKVATGYTRDRSQAIDDVAPVLSPADVAKIDADARQVAADRREKDSELRKQALKRQEAAVRETLREAQATLAPVVYQALLAGFESQIKKAIAGERSGREAA